MKGQSLARFMELRGRRVVEGAGSLWHSVEGRIYMSVPYHVPLTASREAIDGLVRKAGATGARFLSSSRSGQPSGIYVCRNRDYAFSSVQPRQRGRVRRGLECCEIRRVDSGVLAGEGLRLNQDSMKRQGRWDREFGGESQWKRLVAAVERVPEVVVYGAFVGGALGAYMVTHREDGWLYILHQMSREDLLEQRPNHALTFTVTRDAMADPSVHTICYGIISMVANDGLHEYKQRLGYQVEPYASVFQLHPALAGVLTSAPVMGAIRAIRRWRPADQRVERVEAVLEGARGDRLPSAPASPLAGMEAGK